MCDSVPVISGFLMRILVVEDERQLADSIAEGLRLKSGH